MNPLPRDEVGFCFFLLNFSRKSTPTQGEKTSSGNETFEKNFLKKFFFQSKNFFSKLSFPEDVFSPMWWVPFLLNFNVKSQLFHHGGQGLVFSTPMKLMVFLLKFRRKNIFIKVFGSFSLLRDFDSPTKTPVSK